MLELGRTDIKRLVAFLAIPMMLLLVTMASLPQHEGSAGGAETGNSNYWNSYVTNYTPTSNITERISTQNLTISPAANDLLNADSAYRTFTDKDYSVEAINAALASCPAGQTVKLAAGTYTLNGIISVPTGRTLEGAMDGSGNIATVITTCLSGEALRLGGYLDIGAGSNTVKSIKTLNGYYFFGTNSHDFLMQDCEYNGPSDPTAGQHSLYGFSIYMGVNGNYDNGKFVRCIAKNAPTFGFLVAADGAKNSNHFGPNAYSAHNWEWIACEAHNCGLSNINYSGDFRYGCGFDLFEGFGAADPIVGMRLTNCVANNNAADGFHVEYMMDVVDLVFKDCTANDNGQWFKTGRQTNPQEGVLIGTGFYLGGSATSQTKVINCQAGNNWGYSTQGGGQGIVDSSKKTDSDGTYSQGKGAE